MSSARLCANKVAVTYDAPGGGTLPALGPVSFDIPIGQFVSLVGPSGCGKSTLIRLLAGLQPPSQGDVCLDGLPITQPNRRVGLMFQDANLMPWRTVQDNVALPLELANIEKATRYAETARLLGQLGLSEFAEAYPGELSGGMAQRVAIGRVLIQQPDVMLLDEPFGALDALTREQVSVDLFKVCEYEQQTVLMVTHDINEAVLLTDRVLVMSRRPGRIIADIPVTLPRPRSLDVIYSDAFGDIARSVRAAIDRA